MPTLTLRDPLNQVRAAFAAIAVLLAARGHFGPAAVLAILLVGTLLPVLLGVPRPFEAALVLGLSLQAIGTVLGLFRPDFGWDIVVHTVLTGAAGTCAYMALVSLRALPDPTGLTEEGQYAGVLIVAAALGMALGTLWEVTEAASDQLLGTALIRSSLDTSVDLLANAIGAITGGVALAAWARSSEPQLVEPGALRSATETPTAE